MNNLLQLRKVKIGTFLCCSLSSVSLASGVVAKKTFALCFGDHHGSYLSFVSSTQDGVVKSVDVQVTTDADESESPGRTFKVTELTKNSQPLTPSAFSWVIRQAIKSPTRFPDTGFIKIRAVDAIGTRMDINLQKPVGSLTNAVSIDGYIEELTCPIGNVVD
jgi:hypothetical protein